MTIHIPNGERTLCGTHKVSGVPVNEKWQKCTCYKCLRVVVKGLVER